ncbi:1,4-dihydroxy-2-naphthoate polyprenyltransferase [Lacticaseibacillus jixiensis]|uniref:1,4-dihydroxy-2-naphthoate polyprenyltransferase n=1 Tax=Lacticaseibacillus jixiensis TaxID=3231926 RepID=UPI0036F2E2E2
MTIRVWLELVEARTKLASILPGLIGLSFAWVYYGRLDVLNSAVFFVAMLVFDMTTTAINNLMDYRKAQSAHYVDHTNVIGKYHLDARLVAWMILGMLAAAAGLGLYLVVRTSWVLLLLGGACFVIGICYTFGPLPLNRLPLGEVFSGVTMGLGIPLIAVFVNPNDLFSMHLAWPNITGRGDWQALAALGLVCITPMATIANIMLANNLSDIEEDLANHRTTLPMYLSHRQGLWLHQALAYGGYASILVIVIWHQAAWPLLLTWLGLPFVIRATKRFVAVQDKRKTFKTAIINLVIENAALVIGLLATKGGWQ